MLLAERTEKEAPISEVNYMGSWNPEPYQIVSLWEMIQYPLSHFILNLNLVQKNHQSILRALAQRGRESKVQGDDAVAIKAVLETLIEQCQDAELDHAVAALASMRAHTEWGTLGDLEEDVRWLEKGLFNQLSSRHFIYIPTGQAKALEQDMLFGDEVHNNFPSAQEDIKEAGNCYALGRYTACVFHLMRALEVALDALWKSLNTGTPTPNTWGDYIKDCEGVVKNKALLTKTRWAENPDLLRSATMQLIQIKNLWRNSTMHVQNTYKKGETSDIFEQVRMFMQHLARGLSESGEQKSPPISE